MNLYALKFRCIVKTYKQGGLYMFGFGVKQLDKQIDELLETMSRKIEGAEYSEAEKLVSMAKVDHQQHQQLPQTVASKLSNSLYFLKLSDATKVPSDISIELTALRRMINKGGAGYVANGGGQSLTAQYHL